MEFLKLYETHEDYERDENKPIFGHCIEEIELHFYEREPKLYDYLHIDGTFDNNKTDDVIGICILTDEQNTYNPYGPIFVLLGGAQDSFSDTTFTINSASTTVNNGLDNSIFLSSSEAANFKAAKTATNVLKNLYYDSGIENWEEMAEASDAVPYLPSVNEFSAFFNKVDLNEVNEKISEFNIIYYEGHPIMNASPIPREGHWLSSVNKYNNPSYMTAGESQATYPSGSITTQSKKIRPFLHLKKYIEREK